MTSTEAAAPAPRVRIWDLPVRLTHGLIVALFLFQWWTGETGRLGWHFLAGDTIVGLLAFRLLWGVLGSSTARFSGFVRGPVAVVRYGRKLFARGGGGFRIGHNPLGGWSVVLMLGLLVVQTGLGLFAIDTDGDEGGPLSSRISFDAARTLAHRHATVFDILLAVVGLHVLAALAYLVIRRDNLIGPMLTGARRGETADAPMTPAGPVRFAICAALGAGVGAWASKGFVL